MLDSETGLVSDTPAVRTYSSALSVMGTLVSMLCQIDSFSSCTHSISERFKSVILAEVLFGIRLTEIIKQHVLKCIISKYSHLMGMRKPAADWPGLTFGKSV